MPTVGRFGEQWASFEERIVPPSAGPLQRQETRRAFYAGGWALLSVVMASLSPGEEPTDEDLQAMDRLKAEFDDFAKAVREGRA